YRLLKTCLLHISPGSCIPLDTIIALIFASILTSHLCFRLPYTRATIHEVQRVLNLIAFVVHCALEDCNFEGYDIPKGTVFLANMEDAMTDPKLWKNPDEFDPNNFLDDNGKYVKNGAFVPFGIGKRQCVGEALARMEVFVFLSSLFQKFTFTLVGEEVPPGNLYTFNAPVEFNAVAHVRPHL
ncbi:hypothetical protein OTU49_006074, partial [Cherax quadricarinatus]